MAQAARELAVRLLDPARRFEPAEVRLHADAGSPGLYAWFVDEDGAGDLSRGLGLAVAPGLLYAGQAGAGAGGATLASRILGNHIGGNTYASTFRLTLATVLERQLGLVRTAPRRIDRAGEPRLSAWMTGHLSLATVAYPDRAALHVIEADVLALLDPPFNLARRPPTPIRARLKELRRSSG
jgi:hypothetical protein